MRFALAVLLALPLTLAVTGANAQVDSREGIALQNQIYQLRQELRAVQDQAARGGGGSSRPPAYAPPPAYGSNTSDLLTQLLGRVDSLEEQVRQLRGRLDETHNQLQQATLDLNKKIDDLAFQTTPQGGQPSLASPGPAPVAPLPTPQSQPQRPAGPRTPELAMQEGNAALARRDYPAAEAAAKEVLANRTSPRAYDAKLLLAQALQGQKLYPQAAVAFDDAYNLSRKGTHAQDALLGLASSLASIKETKAACDTLSRLRTDFPQPRPDIKDGMASVAQRANCH